MDLYNSIFLTKINPILKLGSVKPLDFHDLPILENEFKSETIFGPVHDFFNRGKRLDLYFLWKIFGARLILSGLLKFTADIIGISSPYVLKIIINTITNSPNNKVELVSWSIFLFLLQCLNSLAVNYYFLLMAEIGYKIRTIYSIAIYRKLMQCFQEECIQDTGKILNMISSDVNRLESATLYIHYLWSGPLQAIIIICFLWKLVGLSSIIGLIIFLIFIPIQSRIVSKLASHRKKAFAFTDRRIKLLQELIRGIRIVKLYLWENIFYDKIMEERRQEQSEILKSQLCRSFTVLITVIVPVFSSISTFIFYSLFGSRLYPSIVFPTLAYYNLLRYPLSLLPMVISLVIDAKISLNRILDFLSKNEILDLLEEPKGDLKLSITDGFFDWGQKINNVRVLSNDSKDDLLNDDIRKENEDEIKCLRHMNLSVNLGELILVIGTVGSGKSSLLKAIVGEMRRIKGVLKASPSVSYCPQQPWIQNCSLRDNILFNSPFSKERYKEVLEVCSLDQDVSFLINGDLTSIGENGANLSGGQKQRIALARAAYSDSDLVILDDPISSVDAKLAKYIFDNCIRGFLASKTRIMATNDVNILGYADRIYLMDNLQIIEQGTYQEIVQNHTKFNHLLLQFNDQVKEKKIQGKKHQSLDKSSAKDSKPVNQSIQLLKNPKADLMEAEERSYGTISSSLYMDYIQFSGGLLILSSIIISLIFANLSRLGHDLWLTFWSMAPDTDFDTKFYTLIYLAFGITQGIFVFVNGVLFVHGAKSASTVINMKSLRSVIDCPISFFDQNPIGRIINRFGKDLDTIDNMLPEILRSVFSMTFNCTFSILMICCASWGFIFPLIPLIFVYIKIQRYYRYSSREIKRMEALSRSPLLSLYSETISGLPVIRSFRAIEKFLKINLELLDRNNQLQYFIICIQRWVSVRIEMLGNFITFCTSISCVFGIVSPGMAGLALSYALSITSTLNWLVRQFAECEAQAVSFERLSFYANNLDGERMNKIHNKPPENWPSEGAIELENVYLKYREGSEVVLKNISFNIKSQERVAIIGRTGAGKSSLISALFRFVEISSGRIMIDGVDISSIDLSELRNHISIAPQEPFIFNGTIRQNLDPSNLHSDIEIWDALSQVSLKSLVSSFTDKLDTCLGHEGEELSIGQKQLLCLARLLLKRNRILVLDEITANIDHETEGLIQETLKTSFKGCTVLTIAHRLRTIMDHDKVILLDHGQLVECGYIRDLAKDPDSRFFHLVREDIQNLNVS